jgi:hypothetical protein
MLFILHADHEQNCSTSTVRLVGSSRANLFTSISGGINALWGPLHGGANQAVLEMLEKIRDQHGNVGDFVRKVKDREDGVKLMGFGHRVYKNYDPRAALVKATADEVLADLGANDELLDLAKQLEAVALSDEYFISRKLYPNVDFYTGLIYKAMGFPTRMFTVLFALGRQTEGHPQEVLHQGQRVVRVQERLPLGLLEGVGGDGGQFAQQPDGRDLDLLVVGGVQRVLVVGGERVDHAGQHRHRVSIAREAIEEPLQVLVQHGVPLDPAGECGQLVGRRQLAVDQQIADLDEGRLLGQLLDRVAAVAQDPGVAVDVGDGALDRRGVGVAVVEGRVSGLGEQRTDGESVGPLGRLDDRQF